MQAPQWRQPSIFLHHRLAALGELVGGRGTAQKQAHARAGVNLNACRTWHTVTAAAAEVAGELFLVFLDDRLDFIRHGRRTGNVA